MSALALLVRLGLRSALRRPQQTVLIVVGLTLSTVLITASFALGDSFGASQRASALTQVGGADAGLTGAADPQGRPPLGAGEAAAARAALESSGQVTATAAVAWPVQQSALYDDRTQQVSAENTVLGAPPELDAVWGPLRAQDGSPLTFAALQPGQVYVSPVLARWVGARAGDRVLVFVGGKQVPFTVRAVLADTVDPTVSGNGLAVVLPLGQYQELTGAAGSVDAVLATTRGHAAYRGAVPDGFVLHAYRQDALRRSRQAGATATDLVLAVSALMIGAGLLLVYLVYVVLVAERRRELGVARAIGMRRAQVVTGLAVEGAGYSLAAAAAGLPLGVAAAWALTGLLNGSQSVYYGQYVSIAFHAGPDRLVESFLLGFSLTVLAVVLSAWRVSRVQVVAAIRDLPDGRSGRRRPPVWLALAAPAGLALAALGLRGRSLLAYETGVTLLIAVAALGLPWLAGGGRRAGRLGLSLLGATLVVYWAQPFGPVERLLGLSGPLGLDRIPTGVEAYVGPVVALAGAVLLVVQNADLLARGVVAAAGRVRGLAPVSRTATAYPLTYRFRTGLTAAMFATVTFAIVLVLTLTGTFSSTNVDRVTGGYQLQTDSPGLPADLQRQVLANPKLATQLDQVTWAEKEGRQFQQVLPGTTTPVTEGLVRAADDQLLQSTTWYFAARATGYGTDRQVWDAVRTQPGTAVMIMDPRLVGFGGVSSFRPFQERVIDGAGGSQTVTVIGLLPFASQWPYMYVSAATGARLFGAPVRPNWWVFRLKPGADPYRFRLDLGAAFGARYGLEPELMLDKAVFAKQTVANLTRFLTGYLALGLVVGVSAVGIIAGRAVVERRQQIGVMRAIGFSGRLVGASFLLESGFTAVTGLLAGTAVAIWAAYRIAAVQAPGPSGGPADFAVPVPGIALLLAACCVATLVGTWLPARAAARTRPAEALRSEA